MKAEKDALNDLIYYLRKLPFVRYQVNFNNKLAPAALGYQAETSPDLPIPCPILKCLLDTI